MPQDLAGRLNQSETAFCLRCGHLYRADRYTRNEIDDIFTLLGNKDDTTTAKYMLREGAGTTDNKIELYSHKEYIKWKKRLSNIDLKDSAGCKKILVLRPASIGCLHALNEVFDGAYILWKDYSRSAESQIRQYKQYEELTKGFVRSYFAFNDLNDEFDLVVINHCLQHSVSLNDDIRSVKDILANDGKILLVNEVNRKLHNPFHINHFSESGLRNFLARHFEHVDSFPNGIGLDEYKSGLFEGAINKDFLAYSAIVKKLS